MNYFKIYLKPAFGTREVAAGAFLLQAVAQVLLKTNGGNLFMFINLAYLNLACTAMPRRATLPETLTQ